jgi:HEPN domain-containing protein
LVCFHCQQAVEKYLKAYLYELGASVPKTHDLDGLLVLLLPHDPTLKPLRRAVDSLTTYAVEYRYPIARASVQQMRSALRVAERVRKKIRSCLGLVP